MATGARLQLKQSQSLHMTPQLMQSIKLLQFGHAELIEYVKEEVERNPLLELTDETVSEPPFGDKPTGTQSDEPGNSGEGYAEQTTEIGPETEDVFENEPKNAESAFSSTRTGNTATQAQAGDYDFISNVGEVVSLAQTLEFQIAMNVDDETLREVANYIANAVDDDGYFREDLAATAIHLGVSEETVRNALKHVQALEPCGIGARDLAECLKLQLVEKGRFSSAMQTLIGNLDLLAKREFIKLKRLCRVNTQELGDMIEQIKTLDPRPAARYLPVLADTIVPDVMVTMKNDGSWSIDLNPDTLPNLLVNRHYHAELASAVGEGEAKIFVDDCFTKAKWLERSLDQRAQTILKVTAEIVRQQDMFFAEGVEHLRPMNLATIASAIKMHESTVSRVTSNKYLLCDQGIFELKYFFSSAIASADDDCEQRSSQSVKHQIKKLVDAEDPQKVLSDDKIVEQLQQTGIDVARRTVAKYRDAMKIPSSVQRRREKNSVL